jgi:hypothetical protein
VPRTGLWKAASGAFAGWRDGDQLYDASGCHVGRFKGDVAYSPEGDYLGEIYRDDWIGKQRGSEPAQGEVTCSLSSITVAPLAGRDGLGLVTWQDPDF